jgi:protein-disulfide isomerase
MSKQARLKTQEMRRIQAEAARRESRRRRIIAIIGGVVVLALVAAIVVAVVRAAQGGDGPAGADGDVVVPANTSDGSIPVGQQEAPVTVAIYFDYMCPACGQLEETQGQDLDQMLDDGEVDVDLRPISFLDQTSMGTQYSTRSANALATVADGAPEHVWDFHQALFVAQPEEGTQGLSDDQIAEIATDVGVPGDVVDRFEERTYDGWVEDVTEAAFDSGITQTPTVLVDGEEMSGNMYTPGALRQAVAAAGGSGTG